MRSSALKRLDRVEPLVLAQSGKLERSVYGVVDRVDKIDGKLVPHFIRRWKGVIGNMEPTEEDPTIFLVEKLEPMILKHKKYKCMYGGRAGTKSRFAQDTMSGEINSCASKVYVLRERMKSLKESIYAGIVKSIKDLNLAGFLPVPSHWEIRHRSGGIFTFGGMQNIIDMKGSSNYKYFLMEEAARTKQATIDTLGPTLRDTPGAELWWLWNPESSTDAMSQEFIVPYQAELDKNGYYEDEFHLIIKVGHQDNPWFEHDESLQEEFKKDSQKLEDGRMSHSRFNHIWNGEFNDDIDTSIITGDWFDACIDAHIKLNFGMDALGNLIGGKVSTLDPADVGKDANGYTERQGVIFTTIDEIDAENANRAFDVAALRAKTFGAAVFGWDCDGMGAILRDQAGTNFDNTNVKIFMYKGSTEVHFPEATFKTANTNIDIKGENLNKDVLMNKKAQNIVNIAERMYKTYEAVTLGKYHDPDTLISFNSKTIASNMMQKLRAECCKVPLKPSDKIRFYTKEEMRRGITMPDGHKVVIPSPNLFDACVLSFDHASTIHKVINHVIPKPLRSIGKR